MQSFIDRLIISSFGPQVQIFPSGKLIRLLDSTEKYN